MRLAALVAYSQDPPACACCGETRYEFLALDHINGNGAAHRREIKMKGSGIQFYRWLRVNSYPVGLRVLCHNCNLSKGFYGECPHVTEARASLLRDPLSQSLEGLPVT